MLPNEIASRRKTFERMIIRDFASVLDNEGDVDSFKISEYKLTNSKIDSE